MNVNTIKIKCGQDIEITFGILLSPPITQYVLVVPNDGSKRKRITAGNGSCIVPQELLADGVKIQPVIQGENPNDSLVTIKQGGSVVTIDDGSENQVQSLSLKIQPDQEQSSKRLKVECR